MRKLRSCTQFLTLCDPIPPSWGVFFIVFFISFEMTALTWRAITPRLEVAYLADAYFKALDMEFDRTIKPQNTYERITCNGIHRYADIWNKIIKFNEIMNFDELSDADIHELYLKAFRLGFECRGTSTLGAREVSAEAVQSAYKAWRDAGWFTYEQKRNKRRETAGKFVWPVILLGSMGL